MKVFENSFQKFPQSLILCCYLDFSKTDCGTRCAAKIIRIA
nr:MAG TPA: hypothetical protein [Caudoviricetes sp.]